MTGVRGVAPFLRRAELLQMQVADAGFIEAGGELAFGESRAARGRDRARIHHEADLGALELADDGIGLRLLVADGEQLLHVFNRSINSIAAAGARTLPSWITYANTSRGAGFAGFSASTCGRSFGTFACASIFSRSAQ